MRSQDEIRKNLDFRERLIMEKQRSEKEQMESRYLSMDSTAFINISQYSKLVHEEG